MDTTHAAIVNGSKFYSTMSRRTKQLKFEGTKRMQTEMQATIAFACYDNEEVLKDGKGMNKKAQVTKIVELYMPSVPDDKLRMCYVDQFLSGSNQFKALFQCKSDPDDKNDKTIPEELHRELGRHIFVGKEGIGRSLLTSKNLSNPQDISGETLYRHAKEVEANCKKALSLCLQGLTMEKF